MDLLSRAYASGSDDDDDGGRELTPPALKRLRSEAINQPPRGFAASNSESIVRRHRQPGLDPSAVAFASSSARYVSKRERMLSAVNDPPSAPPLATVITPPVVGSIEGSDLAFDVLSSIKHGGATHEEKSKVKAELPIALIGHSKPVLSIQWSQKHVHLLASAGLDQTVRVWNVWCKDQKLACVFNYHNASVKDVRWCQEGLCLLSCGYDGYLRLVDVERGIQKQQFKDDQVDVIKFHPKDSNIFLSGGSKGILRLWDLREKKPIKEYSKSGLGPILDVDFSTDAKYFVCSSDISKSRISENAIVIWDLLRQVPLSNQVYNEAYTCPCVKYHPSDPSFIAQSNGNYIAIFSARPPFRLDKNRRYEGHGVWGYPVKCSFNADGKELASGSSDGSIYFFDYYSSQLRRKIMAFEQPCIDVAFHPLMPNVFASSSWAGEISVFE